eukprot:4383764-Ditylum_brightwellii.AAC.1
MSRLETKEVNWFEEGTRALHDIAKGLSDLKKQTNMHLNKKVTELITLVEYNVVDTLDDEVYLLQFKLIQAEQQQDKYLLEKARISSTNYKDKGFKKQQLICLNDKVVVPKSLHSKIVNWYHVNLCQPGQTKAEVTDRQHVTNAV